MGQGHCIALHSTVNNISFQFISKTERIHKVSQMDIHRTSTKITSSKKENDKLHEGHSNLQNELDDLEQQSRRNCLLVYGIKENH